MPDSIGFGLDSTGMMPVEKPSKKDMENSILQRKISVTLSPDEAVIYRKGMEFLSGSAIAPWSEIDVTLQLSENVRIDFSGVVISCSGNRSSGYRISAVFSAMSKPDRKRIDALI